VQQHDIGAFPGLRDDVPLRLAVDRAELHRASLRGRSTTRRSCLPPAALGHRKPIDVLAAGGYEELSRLVAELEAPVFT